MARYAVIAVGADRPGIVAAVTRVFVDQGCNLADTSMTILGGHFAMMLVVSAPEGTTAEGLERALAGPASAMDLVVTVRPLAQASPDAPVPEAASARFTASVYGADRPGIVHGVAELLAGAGVNIVDLSTRVIGDVERPVYAMVLELAVPAHVDPGRLAEQLQVVAGRLGVDATLHASEADIL